MSEAIAKIAVFVEFIVVFQIIATSVLILAYSVPDKIGRWNLILLVWLLRILITIATIVILRVSLKT